MIFPYITKNRFTRTVFLGSFLIAICIGIAIWDINYWPTDTEVYYFDAAIQLPHLKYLSEIHKFIDTEKIRWLHGKEIFIVGACAMQWLLNDFDTLRSFIMVCLIATFFSSWLVFLILREYWGDRVAFICWFAFVASVWPYVYILFAKHQPLGMCFSLLALFLLLIASRRKRKPLFYFLSGLCLGLAFFSSTVSSLYVPYYFAGFVTILMKRCQEIKDVRKIIREVFLQGVFIVLGIVSVFVYVNFPDILKNLKMCGEYVYISGAYNHFFYNQPFLQEWFQLQQLGNTRGGWLWIFKYFFVIMPVLFPIYLLTLVYLVARCFREPSRVFLLTTLGLVLVSLSSPLLAEVARVAQYGANYFPSILGIIMLVGYGAHLLEQKQIFKSRKLILRGFTFLCLGVAAGHLILNAYIFLTDVYPCRMVTTLMSRKIEQLKIPKIYTYQKHPCRNNFVLYVNPELYRKMHFVPIQFIIQPQKGCIMVPPLTGNSIYIAATSTYTDFEDDVFLNELLYKKKLPDYALASFKTLASSRIWLHEEEILSYRKLILNHKLPVDDALTRVWLLDGKKVYDNFLLNIPNKDYLEMYQENLRNIGTETRLYRYEGYGIQMRNSKTLNHLAAPIYKKGDPNDSLVAYVYKIDDKQVVFVAYSEHFASKPLPAGALSHDKKEGLAVFEFDPPLELNQKFYYFTIYRTGKPDDKNFYRIHLEKIKVF